MAELDAVLDEATTNAPTLNDEQTFRRVVSLMKEWGPDEGSRGRDRGYRLVDHLDAGLNETSASQWDRGIVERWRGNYAADVSVNGEIGVAIVGDARVASVRSIKTRLDVLGERYNYVVVCWWDDSSAHADVRRTVERNTTARRLGLDGLAFCNSDRASERDGRRSAGLGIEAASVAKFGVVAVLLSAAVAAAARPELWIGVGPVPALAAVFLSMTGLLFLFALTLSAFAVR